MQQQKLDINEATNYIKSSTIQDQNTQWNTMK